MNCLADIISVEKLSAEFILENTHNKVRIVGDRSDYLYSLLKSSADVVENDASLIIGYGGEEALVFAKNVALVEGKDLTLIPTTYCLAAFSPLNFGERISPVLSSKKQRTILCDQLLSSSRDSLAEGVAVLSARLLFLFDQAYEDMIFGKEEEGEKKLSALEKILKDISDVRLPNSKTNSLIKNAILRCNKYISDVDDLPYKYATLLSRLRGKRFASDLFVCCFAIYSAYISYDPKKTALLPPDRGNVAEECEKFFEDSVTNCVLRDMTDERRKNYVTVGVIEKMKEKLMPFGEMSKVYRSIAGSDGFFMREEADAAKTFSLLPLLAEIVQGYPLLKNLYYNSLFEKI